MSTNLTQKNLTYCIPTILCQKGWIRIWKRRKFRLDPVPQYRKSSLNCISVICCSFLIIKVPDSKFGRQFTVKIIFFQNEVGRGSSLLPHPSHRHRNGTYFSKDLREFLYLHIHTCQTLFSSLKDASLKECFVFSYGTVVPVWSHNPGQLCQSAQHARYANFQEQIL